jgi:multiple sugar transport system ATP-binding protein
MKDGFMQQVDAPQNLYDFPINKFVAGFIGSPQMNFFDATLVGDSKAVYVEFGNEKILLPRNKVELMYEPEKYINTGRPITFGIRPEDLHDDPKYIAMTGFPTIEVKVDVAEMLGNETLLYCKLASAVNNNEESIGSIVDDVSSLIARVDSRSATRKDDVVKLALDLEHAHFFDAETEQTLSARSIEEKKAFLNK